MLNHFITDATDAVKKARVEVEALGVSGQATAQDFGTVIVTLLEKINELHRDMIIAKVKNGMPTKLVAEQHGISPSRVSQIAPRRP